MSVLILILALALLLPALLPLLMVLVLIVYTMDESPAETRNTWTHSPSVNGKAKVESTMAANHAE